MPDGSVALAAEKTDRRHNETLPGMVEELLQCAEVGWSEIGLMVVSIGPGSFTGLRVGVSFAKGAATALGVPLLPAPTLMGLATTALHRDRALVGRRICPMVPARRGESFGQVFATDSSRPIAMGEPFLADAADAARLADEGIVILGEGAEALTREISRLSGRDSVAMGVRASAADVALLGLEIWQSSLSSLPTIAEIEPLYLKEFTVKPRAG